MRIRVQEHKQWSNSTVIFLLIIVGALSISLFLCITSYLDHRPAVACRDYVYDNNRKVCLIPEEDIN